MYNKSTEQPTFCSAFIRNYYEITNVFWFYSELCLSIQYHWSNENVVISSGTWGNVSVWLSSITGSKEGVKRKYGDNMVNNKTLQSTGPHNIMYLTRMKTPKILTLYWTFWRFNLTFCSLGINDHSAPSCGHCV